MTNIDMGLTRRTSLCGLAPVHSVDQSPGADILRTCCLESLGSLQLSVFFVIYAQQFNLG